MSRMTTGPLVVMAKDLYSEHSRESLAYSDGGALSAITKPGFHLSQYGG